MDMASELCLTCQSCAYCPTCLVEDVEVNTYLRIKIYSELSITTRPLSLKRGEST